MSVYYCAFNCSGEHLYDNFPSGALDLINNFNDGKQIISILINGTATNARIGRKRCDFGTIFTLTTNPKYVNRYKLFKELVEFSLIAIEPFANLHNAIVTQQSKKIEELIHNITSLNTYSIQDLFLLVPQKILSENINTQKDIIRKIILEKPNVTIDAILKLIKYNLAMKVEFSVFERIQNPTASVTKLSHSIRTLILSIIQIFIDDFEKKRIVVSIDASQVSERRIEIDDDSLFVSLFYLLQNSVKYCCPNSKYKIFFKEEQDRFSILFEMVSIKIEDAEVDLLTSLGYRSDLAKRLDDEGKGIGMYRIVKTLKINNATLHIKPRNTDYSRTIDKIVYEANQFKITFLNQRKWL